MNASLTTLEILVLALGTVLLLADFWMPVERKKYLAYFAAVALGGLLLAGFSGGSFCNTFGTAFNGSFVEDALALFFKRFFIVAAILVLFLTAEFSDKIAGGVAEFYSLIIFALAGMLFAASANDGLITCQGHTISAADITAAPSTANGSVGVRNTFYVDSTTKTLNCITQVNNGTGSSYGGGTAQPLVTNVASMSVAYGVDAGSGSVSGYWPASSVGTNWDNVKSIRITLNFVNPYDATATIPWVQTINLLNR